MPFRKVRCRPQAAPVGAGRADKDFSRKNPDYNPDDSKHRTRENEASPPPHTPSASMRHHGHEDTIVVSPKLASRGPQDGDEE